MLKKIFKHAVKVVKYIYKEAKIMVEKMVDNKKDVELAILDAGCNAVSTVYNDAKNGVSSTLNTVSDTLNDPDKCIGTAIAIGCTCIGLIIKSVLDKRNEKEELNYDEQ